MYRFSFLLLAAFLIKGCDSKIIVEQVDRKTPKPANGIMYALPKTVARLQIKLDKTTTAGATYSPFRPIFAPDTDPLPLCKYDQIDPTTYKACVTKTESYSLQKDATISTYGAPDPDQVYLVKFQGKGAIDQSLNMTLTELGLLNTAKATVTNRTGDLIVSGLKVATGIATKAAFGSSEAAETASDCPVDPVTKQDGWILTELKKGGLNVAPFLIKNYCALSAKERKKFPESGKDVLPAGEDGDAKSFQVLLLEAVNLYADDMFPLVSGRMAILNGTAPVVEPATILTRIEAELGKKLNKYFVGTKKPETWEGTLDLRNLRKKECPMGNTDEQCKNLNDPTKGELIEVLRLDEKMGFCLSKPKPQADNDDPQDAPAIFTIAPDSKPLAFDEYKDCSALPVVALRLNFYPISSEQLFTRIAETEGKEFSFRYRVPAQVSATLCDASTDIKECDKKKNVYGVAVFSVAQLGKVIALPVTRHSKTLTYELTLVESTGGLKQINLSTSGGLDAATIEALGGVATSVIDAKQKDEINELTRQQQLLKLKDDICTIQKKYGLPCSVQPE